MKAFSTEKFIEKSGVEVYPITIVKFLLNRKKILSLEQKIESGVFEVRGQKIIVDNKNCERCKEKDEGMFCRQHTSVFRVMGAENVLYDEDTEFYFYKNEIFKKIGDKILITYCPHPKLIKIIGEDLTDRNIRKINIIVTDDEELVIPEFTNIVNFKSSEFLEKNMKCWFNNLFFIVTLPDKMHHFSNWCLTANYHNSTPKEEY